MGRPSLRNQIIASGMQTVHHRGFSTVGLREITAEAGVAQGSFTNHFASKEEFGVAVLDHYFDQLRAVMAQTLEDESRKPTERLGAYFEHITDIANSSASASVKSSLNGQGTSQRLSGRLRKLTRCEQISTLKRLVPRCWKRGRGRCSA
jgi:TetR/AcrR family transcriptional repressor of nem operon